MKVYVVDGSDLYRERLMDSCSRLPAVEVVGGTADVWEARRAIRELRPDVVTLDIRLPLGSGMDLLTDLKNDSPWIIAIVLTDYSYPEVKKKFMERGADFFFDKAVAFTVIADALMTIGVDPKPAEQI